MSTKIEIADAATLKILDHWASAQEILGGSIYTNGFGILSTPQDELVRLRTAQEEIEKAISALRSTTWPTRQDYEEYDNA